MKWHSVFQVDQKCLFWDKERCEERFGGAGGTGGGREDCKFSFICELEMPYDFQMRTS